MHRLWPALVLVGCAALAGCRSYRLVGDDWPWDEPGASFASGHGGGAGETGAVDGSDGNSRTKREKSRRPPGEPIAASDSVMHLAGEEPAADPGSAHDGTANKPSDNSRTATKQEGQVTSPTDSSGTSEPVSPVAVNSAPPPPQPGGPAIALPEPASRAQTPASANVLIDAPTRARPDGATRQPAGLEIPQRMPAADAPVGKAEWAALRDGQPTTGSSSAGRPAIPLPKALLSSKDSDDALDLNPTSTAKNHLAPVTTESRISSPRLRGKDQSEGASPVLSLDNLVRSSAIDTGQTRGVLGGATPKESRPGKSTVGAAPAVVVNSRPASHDAQPVVGTSLSLPQAWLAPEEPAVISHGVSVSSAGTRPDGSPAQPAGLDVRQQSAITPSAGGGMGLPDGDSAGRPSSQVPAGSVTLDSPSAQPSAPLGAVTSVPLPAPAQTSRNSEGSGSTQPVAIDPLLTDQVVDADWRESQLAREAAERKAREQSRNELRRRLYRFLLGRDAPPAD